MEVAVEGGCQQREENRKQRYFGKEEEDDSYRKKKKNRHNKRKRKEDKFQRTNSSSHVHEENLLANFEDDKLKEAPRLEDYAYLDQIYVIPKVDERLKEEDLDWLLSNCKMPREPRPKIVDEEASQVWDKPIRIESVDVIAMPYVTPY